MIKLDVAYSDYVDTKDPAYPGGKAVDSTTTESVDGTPLLATWMNDINGTRQALFLEAFSDIKKVSGRPDNVQESDVLKAIKKITQDYTDKKNTIEAQAREQSDAETLKSAKSYTDDLLIKIFQNGYIQWPGMLRPDTLFSFEGYRWAEVNYDGCFFRAKGKDAEAFDSDEQGDAIRNITGNFLQFPSFQAVGCFSVAQIGISASINGGAGSGVVYFNASNVVPTAEENRPRNKTFIIWKLEKI